ncbi:MAG: tetratricopeptide repeat protein [Verrucomicrobiota bacterium]
MTRWFFCPAVLCAAAVHLVSCGADDDVPPLAGTVQANAGKGEALYQKAQSLEKSGRSHKAVKVYDELADKYPYSPSAANARFRQAELLEGEGKIEDAFEAYDALLVRYPGHKLYKSALARQASMAQRAAQGDIKSSFLGIKSKLSLEKTVEMLGKVRTHAPRSRAAAKAQFTIGELYHSKKKSKEAIAAFRELVKDQPDMPEASEALFRVGVIYLEEAERGNQSQGTLDLSREAFNDYLMQYPGHHRNAEARRKIANLQGKDLQRSYDVAKFYQKTGKTEAAKVYYRDIIKSSGSGKLHDAARARLRELGE